MDNGELRDAIEAAWSLIQRTCNDAPTYKPTVEHYNALLKEQARRASEDSSRTPQPHEQR